MDIKEIQGQGTVGKSIELSTLEIRVFNKKWFEVTKVLNASRNQGKESIRMSKEVIQELNNLFFKWFGDVPMESDIEAMMFGHPEGEEDEDRVTSKTIQDLRNKFETEL